MKLADGVEWAIHCCTVLGTLPEPLALPARRLAEFHGVPEAYLAKHLQALTRAGVLRSVSGPKGGFRLARAPEDITVLDIVEAIDGTAATFRCAEIRQRGPGALGPEAYRSPCTIHTVMRRVDKAWRDELRATTIADLIASLATAVDPRSLRRSAEWLVEIFSARA